MNVTVEDLGPCKKQLRVELEASEVDSTFAVVTARYQKKAQLPGFRAGRAPTALVEKAFNDRISDEVKQQVISETYKRALKEKGLTSVIYPDIEELQFGRGLALQFLATIETAPEFELPEYRGLPAKREKADINDVDVEKALNTLREQRAEFKDAERPLQTGDFVVVNYTGTTEGRPILEIAPASRGMSEQKNFWIHVSPESFVPGFTEQLLGAKAGESRKVTVTFPQDFVSAPLCGKTAEYDVEVVGVKEKNLVPLDDAFAKTFEAESMEKLRAGVKADLDNERKFQVDRDVRAQIIESLLDRVTCELPPSVVNAETRNVVYSIVQQSQQRGMTKDAIEKSKDQIYNTATMAAKDRVKASFLYRRIAEKEEIKVGQDELMQRAVQLAQMYNIEPAKFIQDLQERDGFREVYDEVLSSKVVDFLLKEAKVEDADPVPAPVADAAI